MTGLSDFGELRSSFPLPVGNQEFLKVEVSYSVCRSATNFGSIRDLVIRHLFSKFDKLWSGGPAIPCDDMHQSFTDALVMAALHSRCGHYIFALWFLLLLFSSPNLSRRTVDVYHTSTHGVALV